MGEGIVREEGRQANTLCDSSEKSVVFGTKEVVGEIIVTNWLGVRKGEEERADVWFGFYKTQREGMRGGRSQLIPDRRT